MMKDDIITSLKTDVDQIKNQLEGMVTRSEFVDVERDVIEVQQYSRRNNVEISGLPENLTNPQNSINFSNLQKEENYEKPNQEK